MPIQIIVPEGALTRDAEAEAFRELTELLLRLHGLTGNRFMTPNVIGEVTVVPKGRTFSGGNENICANCLRRLWVACDADHDVNAPSLNSAMAHDGPIEPCV